MKAHAIAAASTLFALWVLLELSARVYIFGLAGLDPRRIDSVKPLWETPFFRSSSITGLVYELEPNMNGFFLLAPLRTNSRGLRDIEYAQDKPANTFRVAVMGSSFTAPSGTAPEDAFHSILEERLSTEFDPIRYEFINFAVEGHAPSQMLILLERRALAYAPDLILVGATWGAARALLGAWDRKPIPRRFRGVSHPIFDSFLLELVKKLRRPDPPNGLDGPPESSSRPTVIDRLGKIRKRTAIPIVVVRLSTSSDEPLPREVELERRAEAAGLYYMDTRSAFRGRDPRDFWIHKLNPHPNASAHALFADEIEEFLRANRLLAR